MTTRQRQPFPQRPHREPARCHRRTLWGYQSPRQGFSRQVSFRGEGASGAHLSVGTPFRFPTFHHNTPVNWLLIVSVPAAHWKFMVISGPFTHGFPPDFRQATDMAAKGTSESRIAGANHAGNKLANEPGSMPQRINRWEFGPFAPSCGHFNCGVRTEFLAACDVLRLNGALAFHA